MIDRVTRAVDRVTRAAATALATLLVWGGLLAAVLGVAALVVTFVRVIAG